MISILLSAEGYLRSILSTPLIKKTIVMDGPIDIESDYSLCTYDFREDRLKWEVENRRLFLFGKYMEWSPRGLPSSLTSEEFSNINEMDSGKGFSVLYLRNVCYDSESSRIVLFGNEVDKSLLFGMMKKLPRDDFFAVVDGVYPKAAEWKEISSIGGYMFLTDDAMDLISQFASLNFLAHFALHSTRYPALLHALLPFLSEAKDSDTYEYLSILQSFYPSTHAFDLFYRSDFPSGLSCFRELTIPMLIRYANEGSIHLDLYEADTVRIAAYRYYHIYEKFPTPTSAVVLHVTYRKDEQGDVGSISNMDELRRLFQRKVAVGAKRRGEA
ncbi:uncharacterized protein [Blastocystis hominis]|uniref:Uncharacterized protein n=1 Tax=Blastocystis hominis TaxID=12968 RepID=D8M4E8_BLAHO|nr:uncharacterized protein [Blastocystis hominis]CBK22937.2 unnamed protein product [Blastocystis hominis]|eukprot:XP_012896985.1 uncharacterized protein [Blastocystis hominis]